MKPHFSKRLNLIFSVAVMTLPAALSVSCDKEYEFVGVWRATQTKNQQLFVHQFTFRKDHTAMYCIEMPYLYQTNCAGGEFEVTEKGQAVALIGNDETRFTFTKNKKEIHCTELNLTFGLTYK